MKPKNRELCEAVKEFSIASIGRLREYLAKGEEVPAIPEEVPIFDEKGFEGTKTQSRPSHRNLIFGHQKELEHLPEFESLITFAGRTPFLTGSLVRVFSFYVLDQFLRKKDAPEFDGRIFEETYIDCETRLYAPKNCYKCFVLLQNFQSEIGNIELCDGITIRAVDSEIVQKIWGIEKYSDFNRKWKIFKAKFVMEKIYQHPQDQPINMKNILALFDKVISAFRVYKDGVPFYDTLYWIPMFYPSVDMGAQGTTLGNLDISAKVCVLDREEAEDIVSFWDWFPRTLQLKKNDYINISLRRFNLALEKNEPEDKIIDNVIALEALYLKDSDEARYKLPLRAAAILGKTDSQKRYMREVLKKTYDLRSRIVHGDEAKAIKIGKENIQLESVIPIIESYVRQSLMTFLRLSKKYDNKKSIIDAIEEVILNPNKKIGVFSNS